MPKRRKLMNCNHCNKDIPITSQNLDAKFCDQLCYGAWRLEQTPKKRLFAPEPTYILPTGNFPMFI